METAAASIANASGQHQPVKGDASFSAQESVESGNLTIDRELLEDLLREMEYENNFDPFTQTVLIALFAMLIAFGTAGNSLVCFVVARNPAMRTPRNIFIINLAISDLTFCLFTQPFNLLKVLMPAWRLGRFMCKFVPMCAGANVFVSTISITAIALDRFQVIVYPTHDSMKRFGPLISLFTVWLVSLLLASPLAVFNVLNAFEPIESIILYETCVEDLELETQRRAYSITSIVFQYLLPVVIVSATHVSISRKLRSRMVTLQQRSGAAPITGRVSSSAAGRRHRRHLDQSSNAAESSGRAVTVPLTAVQKEKRRLALKRKRKTNLLLVMIAVVFALSWLPLNVCNVVADFDQLLLQRFDTQVGGMAYPICHLLVLSSACFNPLLYGWLNDNFRREFVKVLCCCSKARSAVSNATTADITRPAGRTVVPDYSRASGKCRQQDPQNCEAIELEPRKRYAEHLDVSVNDPEQLISLVTK